MVSKKKKSCGVHLTAFALCRSYGGCDDVDDCFCTRQRALLAHFILSYISACAVLSFAVPHTSFTFIDLLAVVPAIRLFPYWSFQFVPLVRSHICSVATQLRGRKQGVQQQVSK
uniref:Uncharacterized protein n=1 Tax=Trypanosoma congolense (strain IL3000) TaxID=1068625 RepID=G0UQU3_TRYCI|nr:hypothetical protein, unlikely [Trypanosoma congolense IL3000]